MDKNSILATIFANDPLGLLDIKPKTSSTVTTDQRLIQSFEEINNFIDDTGRKPKSGADIKERGLYCRLNGICEDMQKCEILQKYDRHNLLQNIPKKLTTIDDILNDDKLGVFNTDDDIFNLKHVKLVTHRESPDFVARRKKCQNFDKYEPLFKKCQNDLKVGTRQLIKFEENNLKDHTFFILNGLLGYLESTTAAVNRLGNRHDGRTYCIFENGTESEMQFLSLAARLYEARCSNNAFTISDSFESAMEEFNTGFNIITAEDKKVGFIYILKSKSAKPEIIEIDNLYKIGYSTIPVEERIKNAVNEPTYLMASVEIISIYECYNMNPQKFEKLLHLFFGKVCLSVDIYDKYGNRCTPREWFIASLPIIERAIELITTGKIVDYSYDHENEIIKLRKK